MEKINNQNKLKEYDDYIQKALNSVNLSKIYFLDLCNNLYYEEIKLGDLYGIMYYGLISKLETKNIQVSDANYFTNYNNQRKAMLYSLSILISDVKKDSNYITDEAYVMRFNQIVISLRDLEEIIKKKLEDLLDIVETK